MNRLGRKIRTKKERGEIKQHEFLERTRRKSSGFPCNNYPVYRFFKEEEHADSLSYGEIWLSTLETCRKYEDPEQGDPEEAHETYDSGIIVGNSNDPELVEVGQKSGICIGPNFSNVYLRNNMRKTVLPDGYVLCTTTEFSPEKLSDKFGKYCVKISNPNSFFVIVSEYFKNSLPMKAAAAGKVIYKERAYAGMEPAPGPIGFVKPPDIYAPQKEFRFLWITENSDELTPFLLKSPKAAHLCKRIA